MVKRRSFQDSWAIWVPRLHMPGKWILELQWLEVFFYLFLIEAWFNSLSPSLWSMSDQNTIVSIFDSFLTWEVSLYHDDVQQIHCDVILLVVKSGEIWQGWQVKALMVQSRLFWYWRMVSCFRSYPKQKREFVEIDSMLCVLSSMRCPKNPQTNQGFLWTPSKMKPSSCFFQLSFHIFIGGNVLMRSGGHGFDIMLMKCLGMHHAWPMSPVDGKFQKIVVMSPNLNQNP